MGGRILYFVEGWGSGGIESVLMETVRSKEFQREGWHFDIFCICGWNEAYDREISTLGGSRVSCFAHNRAGLFAKLVTGIRGFSKMLRSQTYDVVHVNATNGLGLVYTWLAARHGVAIRIAHAHSASFNSAAHGGIKRLGHRVGRMLFDRTPTARIACSRQAGDFLFGADRYQVIANAIDVERFRFDPVARRVARDELSVPKKTVLMGSLGRMDEGKNPLFCLDVLCSYKERAQDCMCLFVGSGFLESEARSRARLLGVEGSVLFVSATKAPERYYSALDIQLIPSLGEGFGLVAVEGQCSGLPVLASDALPPEVCCTRLMRRISLTAGPSRWADEARDLLAASPCDRALAADALADGPFDAKTMAHAICDVYSAAAATLPYDTEKGRDE